MTEGDPEWTADRVRQRAADWLDQHWHPDRKCPICSSSAWSIGEVVEMRPFAGGLSGGRAGIYPLVIVNCNVCGYTWLLNAILSGALDGNFG